MPAWGGFCSYGVATESVWTADNLGPFGDPSEWIIYGGKLYIFRRWVGGVPAVGGGGSMSIGSACWLERNTNMLCQHVGGGMQPFLP